MGGRRTAFEDLIIIAAKMPWQAGLVLALLSFIGLHIIAVHFASPLDAGDKGHIDALVTHTFLATVAPLAEIIIPPALVLGAGISAWRRSRASALFDSAAPTVAAKPLSWSEFEQLVAELFRRQGYAVTENLLGGADGGVDLVLRKGTEHALVQCKYWRAQPVGASVVRELKGVMATRGIPCGFVVSSGTFTPQAKAFATEARISLVDGQQLMSMRRQFSRSAAGHDAKFGAITDLTAADTGDAPPPCPRCGSPMVRRQARRGTNAGGEFWGCGSFPRCRGTVSV